MDPLLSLAFAMQSGKGVYALLLGSGVSRAAGIPTGWEVVGDLLLKVAALESADSQGDPYAWYRKAHGEEPDYSRLLGDIAATPAQRAQILRGYFEPNDDERERGLKVPTDAHRAIAELVAGGYVRVIVTTNFDRLLETAIEAAGIAPTVVSTPDAAQGVLPLAHQRCLILKVHGDYRDIRIKNTPAEVATLGDAFDRLLDQVFDNFGLVVCGWSAEWDAGLRAALERCNSRRFTTYWAVRGDPTDAAKRLVTARGAELVRITESETFFRALVEKVSALEQLARPHPLSKRVAVESLKRYVVDDRHRILLNDLVVAETEKLVAAIGDNKFPIQGVKPTEQEFRARLARYEVACETLSALLLHGCRWGPQHADVWVRSLERVANCWTEHAGYTDWEKLRHYSALILMYAAGIGALAADDYRTLAAVLLRPMVRDFHGERSFAHKLHTWSVVKADIQKQWLQPGMKTPLSNHLYDVLRGVSSDMIPEEARYQELFDKFEYFLALVYADHAGGWAPVGSFGWRTRHTDGVGAVSRLNAEAEREGSSWAALSAGFFSGSLERFQKARDFLVEWVEKFFYW